MKIRNALGILSSDLPTGNLLWVDAVNGVDGAAVRGRQTIPFRTLTAAKQAALSGDTIMVLPGVYNEKNLLKNGVNWHFFNGARVIYSDSAVGAIFDTGNNGTNGLVVSSISGLGEFEVTNNQATGCIVNSVATNSQISIECLRMQAHDAKCIVCGASDGILHISAREDLAANASAVISVEGDAADNFIEARNIYTSYGHRVLVTAGGLYLKVHRIWCTTDSAIAVASGGTADRIVVDAYEIQSDNKYAVHYNAGVSAAPTLTIRGARIVSLWADDEGYAVYNQSAVSDVVKLANCVLIVNSGASWSVYSPTSGTRIHFLNGVAANKALSGNVTPIGGTPATSTYIS